MTKIIFTADDYGVEDSINDGIIDLVKMRAINSVEVLANYGDGGALSVQNTIKLLDQTQAVNPDLELGVHLTITSGKPIVETEGLKAILCNGHFISAQKTNSKATPAAIYEELNNQIKVLKSNPRIWAKVTHLTNHHDALWFFPEYTEMYVKIAKDYNLPIRNSQLFPAVKEVTYYTFAGLLHAAYEEDKQKSRNAFFLREKQKFPLCELKYNSTTYLDSSHYSLWLTLFDKKTYSPDKVIKRRSKALKDVFDRITKKANQGKRPEMVEVLFHVRKGSINNSRTEMSQAEVEQKGKDAFDKYDLPFYNGITTRYFDGRAIEYASLAWMKNFGELNKWYTDAGVQNGKWSDSILFTLTKA